jgi:ParB family transcriptional regulator, chromosome partitioning protein
MTTTNCIQNSPTPIPRPVPPLAPTSSSSGELWTPPFYVDKVRAVLGEIDLDPFSCAGANLTVKANRFFCIGSAPFRRSWRAKTIFMHPPSSEKLLIRAARRFLKKWRRGRFEQAIVLVNEAPDCLWYNLLVSHADAICVTRKPIPFNTPSGGSQTSGAGMQAFLLFGPDRKFFRSIFTSVGTISLIKKATIRPAKKVRSHRP